MLMKLTPDNGADKMPRYNLSFLSKKMHAKKGEGEGGMMWKLIIISAILGFFIILLIIFKNLTKVLK